MVFPCRGAQLYARLEWGGRVQDKRDSWSGWEQMPEQGYSLSENPSVMAPLGEAFPDHL